MMRYWTQPEAVALCRKVEEIAPRFGAHVALTGGCLYKDGERKDCDVMFYRIRQQPIIDIPGLLAELERIGFVMERSCGWVQKARYEGKSVDLFFPEDGDALGDYGTDFLILDGLGELENEVPL